MRYRLACLALAAGLLQPGAGRAQDPASIADSLITQRLKTARASFATVRDEAQPFGAGRFFNVAVRSAGPDKPGAALFACLVQVQPRPLAPTCIPVPTPGVDPGVTADHLDASGLEIVDVDGDGDPDARFEVSYNGPLARGFSGGETDEYTRFYVFSAVPAPHLAANILVRLFSHDWRVTTVEAEVELRDVNGDAHDDIVLTGQTCAGSRETGEHDRCRPLRQQLLWSRRAGGWSAARAAGR